MSDDAVGAPTGDVLDELGGGRVSRATLLRRAAVAGAAAGVAPLLGTAGAQAMTRGSSANKVTLRFWKFEDTGADPRIKQVIQQWNKLNPNVEVKLQTFPFNDYLATVLPTAFAGKRGPDVFWISAGNLLQYANQGVLQPVNGMIAPTRKDFSPAVIAGTQINGKIQAVPFELTPIALYYRKDLLRAAGVAPPKTWPEVLKAAEKLTTSKVYGFAVEPSAGTYQTFTFMPFLWSTGANTMDPKWKKSLLRTRAAASAFDFWGELVRRKYTPSKLPAITADIGPLARGEAAMQVCGYWAKAPLETTEDWKNVQWGVVQLPAPAGRKSVSVGGGWMQCINNTGDYAAEAYAFTKWMWFQNKTFSHDWSCVVNSEFSSRKSVNAGCAKIQSGPVDKFFRNVVLPTAVPEPRYPQEIYKALGDAIQGAMFGGKSGAEVTKSAADAIDKFLKTYKGAPLGR